MAEIDKKIVLTGLACIHPMGKDLRTCSNNLHLDSSAVSAEAWSEQCFGEHPIGRIPDEYFGQNLKSTEKRSFDRITMVVCDTVGQCVADAGLSGQPDKLAETGIISGSGFGCLETQDRLIQVLEEKGPAYFDPLEFPCTSHNFPISAAAIKFGLKGPITSMVAAMSAGLNALVYSAYQIMKGQTQRMIVVAFDEITQLQYAYLKEQNYLDCATCCDPYQMPKPVYPSESCVAWMLESVQSARQRHARIYAQLGNWRITAGKYRQIDVNAMRRGIKAAMPQGASQSSENMVFVTNGSGFQPDDEAENTALATLADAGVDFHQQIRMKPLIGNCLGAASLMEGALLLYHRHPPQDLPEILSPEAYLFNSFGMGGNLISLSMQYVPFAGQPKADQPHGSVL